MTVGRRTLKRQSWGTCARRHSRRRKARHGQKYVDTHNELIWDQCLQQQTFPPRYEPGPLTEPEGGDLQTTVTRPKRVQPRFKFLTFRKIEKDSFNPEVIISHRSDLCVISVTALIQRSHRAPALSPQLQKWEKGNHLKCANRNVPLHVFRFIQWLHLFLIMRVKPTLQLSLFMIQPENINKTIKMKKQILFFPEARFMTRLLEAFGTATLQRKESFHLKGSAHIICGVSTYFWPVSSDNLSFLCRKQRFRWATVALKLPTASFFGFLKFKFKEGHRHEEEEEEEERLHQDEESQRNSNTRGN